MSDPVSSIVGGISQRNQAKSAGRAASAASTVKQETIDKAVGLQDSQYKTNQGYLNPYVEQGLQGQNQLSYLLGLGKQDASQYGDVNKSIGDFGTLGKSFSESDFKVDPGYNFVVAEGQKALDRASSAKRSYFGGAAQKGLIKFNQNMADTQYQNAYNRYNTDKTNLYNRYNGAANTGYTAGVASAELGKQYANSVGNLYTDKGAVQAQGIQDANLAKQAQANANNYLTSTGINTAVGALTGGMNGGGFSGAIQGAYGANSDPTSFYKTLLSGVNK